MVDYNAMLLDQKRTSLLIADIKTMTDSSASAMYSEYDLQVRLELLESYWLEYTQRDLIVQRAAESMKDKTYFKENKYSETQMQYISSKVWIRSRIQVLRGPARPEAPVVNNSASSSNSTTQASLEKLRLPHFNGNQRDWEAFKEKFTSLIYSDTSMAAVIKFQHLSNCLPGDAAEKLRGIKLIAANFETAWETLCRRYDNKYLRFSLQMHSLVNLPPASKESVKHLSQLLNTVNESINAFTDLQRAVDKWDDVLVYFIESKLSVSTRMDWVKAVEQRDSEDFPKYKEIKTFIEDRIRTLDLVEGETSTVSSAEFEDFSKSNGNSSEVSKHSKKNHLKKSKYAAVHVSNQKSSTNNSKCSFCNEDHFIGFCHKFSACPLDQRRAHAVSARLCFNCLNSNHTVDKCNSKGRCMVCGSKHHTKLHQDTRSSSAQVSTVGTSPPFTSADNETTNHHIATSFISSLKQRRLLTTAWVVLQSPEGNSIIVRALLDSGSEESFLTEHVVQSLALRKYRTHAIVSGIGGSETTTANNYVDVQLKSQRMSNFSHNFSALVLRKLTALVPRVEIREHAWPHLEGLPLADPQFGKPARVDCILSTEVYGAALLPGVIKGKSGSPVAQQTVFGWVLLGATRPVLEAATNLTALRQTSEDRDLREALSRFWEIEEIPSPTRLSPEDEACYDHFHRTHKRNDEGRFVVRLPFLRPPALADSRCIAETCLKRLEHRFSRQPELAKAYDGFMEEYRNLKHMQVIPSDQVILSPAYYLPHHPVIKKDGSNKIRVVFNASQRASSGKSLNSFMHIGPKLQEDILILMIRWSFLPIAFTCDVVKMFRQFLVDEQDQDRQRILWRRSSDTPVETYRLTTVTYGTASAPFIANACMIQLADDEQKNFPKDAEVLRNFRYADDFFSGGDTLSEAIRVRNELIQILTAAGMDVGKWAANRVEILHGIDANEVNGTVLQQETVSTLGIRWISAEDAFCVKLSLSEVTRNITKRSMLSDIACLFDPIGWYAPVIIRAKIMLQNLWLHGTNWDEPVTDEVSKACIEFRGQLPALEAIKIPRWIGAFQSSTWDLHCFSDASEIVYAAALYIALQTDEGITTKLIAAKTKVAPIKTLSLLKLELCGALLLVRLANYILLKLDRHPSQIHCWRDFKIVLAWLRAHPSRWKPFVVNRTSEITTMLPSATWRHTSSGDNPADLSTRGISPIQLRDSVLWWQGPEWLRREQSDWPSMKQTELEEEFCTELESRRVDKISVFTLRVSEDVSKWLTKFSSINKPIRALAFIHRWRNNSKVKKSERRLNWLSAAELNIGRRYLLRLIQREVFNEEIQLLQKKGVVSDSSPLSRLAPFLDNDGLLRVGGRLQNSLLNENEKHPFILPGRHHMTHLFIQRAHLATLHGGATLVQSALSREFWIVKGRNIIRGLVRKCVRCARRNAMPLEQQMGPLPAVRTRPARPFTFTGVDFARPFFIKCSSGRGQKTFKGYVAVFVCMVVKAIHLEVVSDLTTAAFLAAFRRFVLRRGLCKVIYSDNGTNFQGADAELRRLFTITSSVRQEVAAAIAQDGVEWSFIPPRAPNFGGLWEANVKSFKRHLKRVVGESKLTYEELSSVTSMIESCLNSRPLSLMSSSEEDAAALTPGHFLIGASLISPPEPFDETNESRSASSRWHLFVLMRNNFWKRWHKEFLSQTQQRSKWLHPNYTFKEGDVVLFKDELVPPTKWPLARIIRLHQGPDGLSRVATIKSATSEYKRPINKLILLPCNEDASVYFASTRLTRAGGN